MFPWWLWLPTIGPISNEVVGDGIERIALAQTWSTTARAGYLGKAKFLIAHTDKTAVLLNAAHGERRRHPYWFEDLEKDSDNYNWWVNWRLRSGSELPGGPEMLLRSLSLEGGLRLRRSETEVLLSPLGLGNPANRRCS